MIRSIVVFLTVLIIVLFALSNAHHIKLRFIAGEPFNVRLIYLVLFSYLLGVVSATHFFIMLKFNARKKKAAAEESEDDEEEAA
ncbi:MAG TPA: hypothetical protein HPP77_08245 [Candidatus Hydrogenedentes bacterium]|nr:hypothetical protein [Candidatus Hydrogenedentota bacterium]HIJ74280.1 hypothetical protein [Candidatus Hydrogenedentota bacterium]